MKKARIIILIIIQSVLLVAGLIYIGMLLLDKFVLELDAKEYAERAGMYEAARNFSRGNYALYELKLYRDDIDTGPVPTEGTTKPAGKIEGQFQIFYFMVSADTPKMHREIQQAFVDGYNERMRLIFEHPDWFDKYGRRIPMRDLQSNTNGSKMVSKRESN